MIVGTLIGSSIALLLIGKFAPPRPLAADPNGFGAADYSEQANRIVAKLSSKGWSVSPMPKIPKVRYAKAASKISPSGADGIYTIHVFRRYSDKKYMTIAGNWAVSHEWRELIDKIPDSIRESFLKEAKGISMKSHESYNLGVWPPNELRFELRHYCDDLGDGPPMIAKANKMIVWQNKLDGVIRRYITNETDIKPPSALFLTAALNFRIEPLKE